jgi:hypothetical protein
MNRTIYLPAATVRAILAAALLDDMDPDLFAVRVNGQDAAGFAFGVIEDADDGTLLYRFGWSHGAWLVW